MKTAVRPSPIATICRIACTFIFVLLRLAPIQSFNTVEMRAWACHGHSHREMLDRLKKANIIKSMAVYNVLLETDRRFYAPSTPYKDAPLAIGHGQTISAPHMHAHVLQEIYPHLPVNQSLSLLDVGCGSGYLTACFARWCRKHGGHVYGMDIHKELVQNSRKHISADDPQILNHTTLQVGNGYDGWKGDVEFDAIHVGAAAPVVPVKLVEQLKADTGVLIVPVGPQDGIQTLLKIQRTASSEVQMTPILNVRYVPLVQP